MIDIEQLYRKYRQGIFNHLYWLTHDPDLSEDLLQETFLQAIKGLRAYRGGSTVKTWLFSIARHLWIGHLRKKRLIVADADIGSIVVAVDYETELHHKEIIERIFTLVESKDDRSRVIFLLRAEGYSYHEIAERVKVSESSARVINFRTRKWIKGILEKEGYR
ncbi:MAG: RNA polymerase sigma factor [Firmicutes bacterium]|nr:RNA polymerase sigma factor [Bacillota bacterium]